MQKLTLNVEELAVETFPPQQESAERREGTVHAYNSHQVRCTYFCTYNNCTGLPC